LHVLAGIRALRVYPIYRRVKVFLLTVSKSTVSVVGHEYARQSTSPVLGFPHLAQFFMGKRKLYALFAALGLKLEV